MIPPFMPPIPPAPPAHIAERYGVKYCTICGFPAEACRGHAPEDAAQAEADLARRAKLAARGGVIEGSAGRLSYQHTPPG